MARLDILNVLYSKKKKIQDFDWDAITAPPILSLLTPYDIRMLDDICRDPRLNSSISKKKEYIRQILEPRGFVRFASGTNRVVYKFLEDQSFLMKVAVSKPGLNDSPMEMANQIYLKPFCAKCMEVSPMGTIGLFERVETINTLRQYMDVAEDHFRLLNDKVYGKFIMADVGTKFWMNLGIRTGFGLVFVDYPLLYEVDGAKLFCNAKTITGLPCGGAIDWDAGCNFLYCTKCGKQYLAATLAKTGNKSKEISIVKKGESNMKIRIDYKGKVHESNDITSEPSANTYLDNVKTKTKDVKTGDLKIKVSFKHDEKSEEKAVDEQPKESPVNEKPVEEEKSDSVSLQETMKIIAEEIKNEFDIGENYNTQEEEPEIPDEIINLDKSHPTNDEISVSKEEVPKQPYQPKEKIDGAFPASRNMMDNMEEDIEENNPKGYPGKKKGKKGKNKNYSHY